MVYNRTPTKHRGASSEHKAVFWLLEQGYEVFRNVSQHGPVDIVCIDTDGNVHLIDVKSCFNSIRKTVGGTYIKRFGIRQFKERLTDEQKELGVKILVVSEDEIRFAADPHPLEGNCEISISKEEAEEHPGNITYRQAGLVRPTSKP